MRGLWSTPRVSRSCHIAATPVPSPPTHANACQALLYLVPCTLGVVLMLAACRGELAALMALPLEPPPTCEGDVQGHYRHPTAEADGSEAHVAQLQEARGGGGGWHRSRARAAGRGLGGDAAAEQRVALLAAVPVSSSGCSPGGASHGNLNS